LTGQPCQRPPRNGRSREREEYCGRCADPKASCMRLGRSHPLGTAADYVLNPKRCCRVEFKREPIQRSDGARREIGIPATLGALSDVSIEPVPVLQRNSFNEGSMKQKAGFFMVLKRHRRHLRERLAASTGRDESSTKRSRWEHLRLRQFPRATVLPGNAGEALPCRLALAHPKRPRFVWHLRFLRPRRTAIRNPAPEGSGPLRPLGTADALPSPFVAFAGDRSPGFVRWRTTTARNGGGRYIALRVPVHATRFPERDPRPVHAWMSSRPDIGGADSDTATPFGQ
jgi:hypothetical protein